MNLPLLPIPSWIGGTSKTSYLKLKDISTTGYYISLFLFSFHVLLKVLFFSTVQQLDVRLEQGVFFITQVTTLQRQNTHNIASYSARYTKYVF